jgi:hypothetical protein
MAHVLRLTVDGRDGPQPRDLEVARAYNLGFTIRDPEKMRRHLEEVHREGVPMPSVDVPPIIFPISPWATLTDDEIPVQTDRTSGEVEIVVVDAEDGVLVGVGSDHTDRKLEAIDIPWGKQVAPNVMAPHVWRWEDVRDHWDEVTLESRVVDDGREVLYQRASVAEFWTPEEMLERVAGRIDEVPGAKVLFSGTVVSESEQLLYGERFTMTMHDPVLDRTLRHSYHVTVLHREIRN